MRRSLAFLLVLACAAPAAACLWDYDTLAMERQRFPDALELIAGKFLRHSDGFYEWRVADRRARIAAHDSGTKPLSDADLAAAYDDLAVALDKLGGHDDAIAAIREKSARLPKTGGYETHANLGTLLVHAGRYEEGLKELNAALAINPDAHFGRERYQISLVEYLLEMRAIPRDPIDAKSEYAGSPRRYHNFSSWHLERSGIDIEDGRTGEEAEEKEVEQTLKGLLGMMRFGDFRSPALLEAVGDVLDHRSRIRPGSDSNGQRLAARAYLRAAEFSEDHLDRARLRRKFLNVCRSQMPDSKAGEMAGPKDDGPEGISPTQLESQLAREVHEADDWFDEVAKDERLWVAASTDPNPDVRFWEKYGRQTVKLGYDRLPPERYMRNGLPWIIRAGLAGGLVATLAVLAALLWWRKRRPTGYETPEESPSHSA